MYFSITKAGLVLMFLLWAASAHAQSALWLSGCETGDSTEWTGGTSQFLIGTTVRTGGYSCELNVINGFMTSATYSGAATEYMRFYMNVHAPAINISGQQMDLVFWKSMGVFLLTNGSGVVTLQLYNRTTSGNLGSACSLGSNDAWHLIQLKQVISATTGELSLTVDGATCQDSTSINTGTVNPTAVALQMFNDAGTGCTSATAGACATIYYDDLLISTTLAGAGGVIARSVNQTMNALAANWTQTGCTNTTPYACWDTKPFNSVVYLHSATNSAKQTGAMSWTNTTDSGATGYGAQILHSADTVNGAEIIAHGCTVSADANADSTVFINSASSETDTALAGWGACDGSAKATVLASTPTASQLIGSSGGILHAAAGGIDHRIHNWAMMVDYTPAVAGFKGAVIVP